MPRIHELGGVVEFTFDAPTQSLRVAIEVMPVGRGPWYRLLARFSRIVVFDFGCKIPVVINPESDCDVFEELTSSIWLESVTQEGSFTVVSHGGGTHLVAPSNRVAPTEFRHFRLDGTFLRAEWLCTDAEFVFDEQPLPAAPPPIKGDRDPFA
jgi:hypothetical protein